MSRSKRLIAALVTAGALSAVAPVAAIADKPNFNPGQKGNVCSAPGPNSNPNCVPG